MSLPSPSHSQDVSSRVIGVIIGYCRAMILAGLIFGVLGAFIGAYFCGFIGVIAGIICGALYLIPFFGAPIAAGLMALLAFLCAGGFTTEGAASAGRQALVVAFAMLLVNILLDYAITPRLLGKGAGLRPLVALACTMAGGVLFGLWGLILAVPVVGSLNIILSSAKSAPTEPRTEPVADDRSQQNS